MYGGSSRRAGVVQRRRPRWTPPGAPPSSRSSPARGRTVAIAHAGDGPALRRGRERPDPRLRSDRERPLQLPAASTWTSRTGSSAAVSAGSSGSPSTRTTRSNGYFVVYYTAKANDDLGLENGDVVIARYRASTAGSNSVDSSTEQHPPDHRALDLQQPQRRRHGLRARRLPVRGRGRRRAAAAIPSRAARTAGRSWARSSAWPSTSRRPGALLLDPAGQPVRRHAGHAAGDLGLGSPQPLAHRVRPADGRPLHRRRRPGQPRGGELPARRQRRRRELRLAAHGRDGLLQPGLGLPDRKPRRCPSSSTATARAARSPVDTATAARACPPSTAPTCSADFCSKKIWVGIQGPGGTWSRHDAPRHEPEHHHVRRGRGRGALRRPHRRDRPSRRPGAAAPHRHAVGRRGRNGQRARTASTAERPAAPSTSPARPSRSRSAVPASSWFAGWSGACGGTGDCVVAMYGDRSVTAIINPRPTFQFSAPSYSVSEGSGSATITVQRLGTTAGTATVDYAIAAGSATSRRPPRGPTSAGRAGRPPDRARSPSPRDSRPGPSPSRSSRTRATRARKRSCSPFTIPPPGGCSAPGPPRC